MSAFRDYFKFNHGERRGLIVLYTIITALIIYLFFSKSFVSERPLSEAEKSELDQVFLKEPVSDSVSSKEEEYVVFQFDPNTLDADGWQDLGLSEKQAGSIIKYVSKGGKFREPSDLRKMYVIDDEFFNRVKDSVVIAGSESSDRSQEFDEYETFTGRIEINSASEQSLKRIKGIGRSRSASIIKYRDYLGGYSNLDQLYEVYRLDSGVVNSILDQLYIEGGIDQFDINNFEPKELWAHPYVRNWDIVNQITNERDNFGDYKSVDDMFDRLNFESDFERKIKPYLSCDNSQ